MIAADFNQSVLSTVGDVDVERVAVGISWSTAWGRILRWLVSIFISTGLNCPFS